MKNWRNVRRVFVEGYFHGRQSGYPSRQTGGMIYAPPVPSPIDASVPGHQIDLEHPIVGTSDLG